MVHPCRSAADTGGNPRYKMHACDSENSKYTVCGLEQVIEVNVLAGFTSVCRTCFPRLREPAWDKDGNGEQGDRIENRLEE